MRWLPVLLLAVAATACAATVSRRIVTDVDEIQITHRTEYYVVDALDPRSLSRAMWDQGLTTTAGVLGSAAPKYSWRFEAAPAADGSCTLQTLHVEGEVRTTLPRWSPPAGTSQERRLWWQEYAGSIAAHERTHLLIFEKHLRSMVAALRGISARSCEEVRTRADVMLRDGTAAMRREQEEFDRTDTGLRITPPPPSRN